MAVPRITPILQGAFDRGPLVGPNLFSGLSQSILADKARKQQQRQFEAAQAQQKAEFEAEAPQREARARLTGAQADVAEEGVRRSKLLDENTRIANAFSRMTNLGEDATDEQKRGAFRIAIGELAQGGLVETAEDLRQLDAADPTTFQSLKDQQSISAETAGALQDPERFGKADLQVRTQLSQELGSGRVLAHDEIVRRGAADRYSDLVEEQAMAAASRKKPLVELTVDNTLRLGKPAVNKLQALAVDSVRDLAALGEIEDTLEEEVVDAEGNVTTIDRTKDLVGRLPKDAFNLAKNIDTFGVGDSAKDATRALAEFSDAADKFFGVDETAPTRWLKTLANATEEEINAIKDWQEHKSELTIAVRNWTAEKRHKLYGSALTAFEIIQARDQLLNADMGPIQFAATLRYFKNAADRDLAIAHKLLSGDDPLPPNSPEFERQFTIERNRMRRRQKQEARRQKQRLREGRVSGTVVELAIANALLNQVIGGSGTDKSDAPTKRNAVRDLSDEAAASIEDQ